MDSPQINIFNIKGRKGKYVRFQKETIILKYVIKIVLKYGNSNIWTPLFMHEMTLSRKKSLINTAISKQ